MRLSWMQACSLANDLVKLQLGGDVAADPAAACFRVGPDRSDLTAASIFGSLGLAELSLLRPNHPDAAALEAVPSSSWRRKSATWPSETRGG